MSEITPEAVVADLFAAEDTHYDDSGNGWFHEVEADGNVIKVTITSSDDEGFKTDDSVHFRAVVVEGEETPIVFDRAMFEQRVNERFDEAARKLGCEPLAFMPATIAALRAQILALDVDLAESAQADPQGGEVADHA